MGGTFDWVDGFMAKHPGYVELSDRKIQEWAALSGLVKPKAITQGSSNDKPVFNFGVPGMDDYSIQKVLKGILPVVPRNYVLLEVKANLVAEERRQALRQFSSKNFRKVAHVVMGEPNEEFKQLKIDRLLVEKQEKAVAAWKARKDAKEKKKQAEQRQAALVAIRKKTGEDRKKKAEEAKKKIEEAKKRMEAKKAAERGGPVPEEEPE